MLSARYSPGLFPSVLTIITGKCHKYIQLNIVNVTVLEALLHFQILDKETGAQKG